MKPLSIAAWLALTTLAHADLPKNEDGTQDSPVWPANEFDCSIFASGIGDAVEMRKIFEAKFDDKGNTIGTRATLIKATDREGFPLADNTVWTALDDVTSHVHIKEQSGPTELLPTEARFVVIIAKYRDKRFGASLNREPVTITGTFLCVEVGGVIRWDPKCVDEAGMTPTLVFGKLKSTRLLIKHQSGDKDLFTRSANIAFWREDRDHPTTFFVDPESRNRHWLWQAMYRVDTSALGPDGPDGLAKLYTDGFPNVVIDFPKGEGEYLKIKERPPLKPGGSTQPLPPEAIVGVERHKVTFFDNDALAGYKPGPNGTKSFVKQTFRWSPNGEEY